MFVIKWRKKGTLTVITGLRKYTRYEAEKQVEVWRGYFDNLYYIERVA